jgi:hypothetical protein
MLTESHERNVMTAIISLKALVDEMDVPGDEYHAHLNKRTGELVTISDEDIGLVEDGENVEDYPEWRREAIRKTREFLDSDEYLPLPDKFDIHEYSIMERFCYSCTDEKLRYRLINCIHGSGAFRRFKSIIHECGIVDDWYRFRQSALEEIAIEWLEANNIQYRTEET